MNRMGSLLKRHPDDPVILSKKMLTHDGSSSEELKERKSV